MSLEVVEQFKTPQDIFNYILQQLRSNGFLVDLDTEAIP